VNILKRIGLAVAAPLLAFVIAAVGSSLMLLASGDDVAGFWDVILTWPGHRNLVNIVNQAGILYLAGIAAAIGFRMNLFNIGVEGQYRIGAFTAAVVAGEAWLPGKANTVLAIVAAMVAGALWAGIAGLLRVTRGVSEVISTIMLNAIAGLLVGYLIHKVGVSTGNSTQTKGVPESSWIEGFSLFDDSPTKVYGLILFAAVAGVAFWLLLNRTRFGFNLRATGISETAAVAAGVDVKRSGWWSSRCSSRAPSPA
jgi:general nucleoside transport system permease protein